MKEWMCERLFEVVVEAEPMVVPVRFTVTAATKGKAAEAAEAVSVEAFQALAGPEVPVKPVHDAIVLYRL